MIAGFLYRQVKGVRILSLSFISTLSILFVSLVALSHFKIRQIDSGCKMSYMYPYYIRQVKMENPKWTKYSAKYSLYLYREGGFDFNDDAYRIPILFIPGNAGSYKQVRSIARASSETYSEISKENPNLINDGNIGFDYFACDFNEELTAFHGRSMIEQAEFINDSIKYILSLYKVNRGKFLTYPDNEQFPDVESVILIGHSMGGMVARVAVSLNSHVHNSVNTLISLSTPHVSPTINLDLQVIGGNMDGMINSDLAYIEDIVSKEHGFTIFSSSIRNVWLSIDHQSILWCKQLVQSLSRALIDIADSRSGQQTKPANVRLEIFKQRLLSQRLGESSLGLEANELAKTISSSIYSDNIPTKYTLSNPKFHGIYHPRSYFSISSSKYPEASNSINVHLLDNTFSDDDLLKPKNSTFQFLLSSSYNEKEYKVDYLHLVCCNPKDSNSAVDDTNSFIISDPDSPDNFCTFLQPIIPESFPVGSRGSEKMAFYAEISPNKISGCSKIGILQPTPEDQTKKHNFKMHGNMMYGRLVASDIFESQTTYKTDLSDMVFGKFNTEITLTPKGQDYDQYLGSIRTRVHLDVSEDPFFEYNVKVGLMVDNGVISWTPLSIRQSDSNNYESRFWGRSSNINLSIHGRGAYTFGVAFNSDRQLYKGINVDIFSVDIPSGGIKVTIKVDFLASLSRIYLGPVLLLVLPRI
ncbi:GPI inositol-deacylase [Smittium mucronatum]|uniref:GPI inositol-deacylase n=1 Tax=Smittium mucronatum TaxID=133383 RepID=A0A1R0H416_9FUNG|nr:GPI inositol-deacylase [Smittium mucronatum]